MISKLSLAIFALAFALAAEARILTRVPNRNHRPTSFLRDASTLIVGGRPALQGEAPYQLEIRSERGHWCGATLVDINGTQVGVTAAHCVEGDEDYPFELVAGEVNQTDNTGIEQRRIVSKIIIHEEYNWNLQNDIALLFFNQSYQLNENVSTVPLPVQGQVTSEGNLTVSGWGDLVYNGRSPDELQIVKIPLVSDSYCKEAYRNFFAVVDENMICAGKRTGDVSPCHGDSGGPAISDAGYLAGVVSWGYECGHPDYPGVFTKVANFVDWIHATVRDHKNSLE